MDRTKDHSAKKSAQNGGIRIEGVFSFTGMRFSGKTTISKRIGERLKFPVYDTDDEFFHQYHQTISEYVKTANWQMFRAKESGIIMDLFHDLPHNALVSLGGGALAHGDSEYCRVQTVGVVRAKGHVIYLLPSPDLDISAMVLSEREKKMLEDPSRPPLANSPSAKSVFEKTLETLKRRDPLYREAADLVAYEPNLSMTKEEELDWRANDLIGKMALLRRKGDQEAGPKN
jgi:shikimate kinase